MKEVLTKIIGGLLLSAALVGFLLFLLGVAAMLSGGAVALPGLGIIIDGSFLVLFSLSLMVAALMLYWLVGPRRPLR